MRTTSQAENTRAEPLLPDLFSYISGERLSPDGSFGDTVCNPNDRSPLQAQRSCSQAHAELALGEVHQAWRQGDWERTKVSQRAELLERIARELELPQRVERMAQSDAITTGVVITTARRMARLASLVFRSAANYLHSGSLDYRLPGKAGEVTCIRRPWGPALLISPWNAPTTIGAHKIASALAAGAPCIIKPSVWAPHSMLEIAEVIEKCGLPTGAYQLICGSRHIAGAMASDPRIKAISFTGGTAAGRQIAKVCAESLTPTQMELGGNNPLVVFEDADLDEAAIGIVYGLCTLNGQWCRALGRLLVQRCIKNALVERVLEHLEKVRVGDSRDEQSQMGPLIHAQQYQSVLGAIERLRENGGEAMQPTRMPDLPGFFVPPTLVDGCAPEHTREEIFGPVAAVHCFDTESEALALANDTDYGLAAYVYSGNESRATRFASRLRTGGVKINGYSLLSLSEAAPRSAWGLSGLGEEGAAQSIEFFTGTRVIGVSEQDSLGA